MHVLTRAQLKVIAHPLRHRILHYLCGEELSVTQLRDRLRTAPKNLYYHVALLHRSSLIRVTRKERVRATVERYYRARARCFTIVGGPIVGDAGESDGSKIIEAARSLSESALFELERGVQTGLVSTGNDQASPMINGFLVRTTPERMNELIQRLNAWVEDAYAAVPDGKANEVAYRFCQLLFRVADQ